MIVAADEDVDLSRFTGKRVGMCAAAIPVMPLGRGLATLLRRRLYSGQGRESVCASWRCRRGG
ncbi:hypothetical protein [Streptomyces sp. NPDC046859]|uniref:hypothetical protein n=1 Tax=Streptomyces sp. NPDC046859 TaxID=3155734 RepID=UPI0033DAA661